MSDYKAVAGETPKLGQDIMDVNRMTGPGDYAQASGKVANDGGSFAAMGGHPVPSDGVQHDKRGGHGIFTKDEGMVDKFAGPGGPMEVVAKTKTPVTLSGKHPID